MLELPDEESVALAMFHQAVDQHPILGGYLSRHYPYWFTVDTPGVGQPPLAGAGVGVPGADDDRAGAGLRKPRAAHLDRRFGEK